MTRSIGATAEGVPVIPFPAALVDVPRIRERSNVIFLAVRKGSRPAVATTIEGLINYLDTLDEDADAEPDGDEMDASWPEGTAGRIAIMAETPCEDDEDTHDREADDEREEENEDGEGDFEGSGCNDNDPLPNFAQALEALRAFAAAPASPMTVDEWIAKYEQLPPDAQKVVRFGLGLFDKARAERGR